MAVRRVFVPDPDPFPGDPPGWYRATGTDSSETYVTQEGDLYVYMKGGADTVYIRETYLEAGFSSIFVSGGSGNDRLLDRHGGSGKGIDGDGGNDYIEVRSGDDGSSADGGTGNDVLKSLGGELVALHGGLGDDKLTSATTSPNQFSMVAAARIGFSATPHKTHCSFSQTIAVPALPAT